MNKLYLERYGYPKTFISHPPPDALNLVITIPCYKESNLTATLESLVTCTPPNGKVEVLVMINEPKNAGQDVKRQNSETFIEAKEWVEKHPCEHLDFHVIREQLPPKHAGVGLARKAVMDEAYRRLATVNNEDGVIVGLDADSTVDPNYLVEIERYFKENSNMRAACIYYEHPLTGALDPLIYDGILQYELHLRYYVHAQRQTGYPNAYQTIGSAMAVRAEEYAKQGGMNRRKAAEDFYFLHKFIPLGYFGEIRSTRVIPSPRISDRVPFGTGKAVGQFVNKQEILSYDPQLFTPVKELIESLPQVFKGEAELPELLDPFLQTIDWQSQTSKLRSNSKSFVSFQQQFYRWFDGLKMLKLVHFLRDQSYPNVPVIEAARAFLNAPTASGPELLQHFRQFDQN